MVKSGRLHTKLKYIKYYIMLLIWNKTKQFIKRTRCVGKSNFYILIILLFVFDYDSVLVPDEQHICL